MFSNALSPSQAAAALQATRIVRSSEGDALRQRLYDVVEVLRHELTTAGLTCLGKPHAIVPVMIGDEKTARLCHRLLQEEQIAVMVLEYPVVALGAARFRLQVMASHTPEQARTVAAKMAAVLKK